MATNLKSEVALLQTLSRFFYPIQFVKCWLFFLDLNAKRLHQSSGQEKESRCLVCTSSTKCEIGPFNVVVGMQLRQRNVKKGLMPVQSCCFVYLNLLLFAVLVDVVVVVA